MFDFVKKLRFCLLPCALSAVVLSAGCGSQKPNDAHPRNAASGGASAFVFMSDLQADPETGDYSALGLLLEKALSRTNAPRLLVLGGDNVNNGSSEDEWRALKAAAGGGIDGITVASAAGNHDSHALLLEQFDYPDSAPGSSQNGFFYSFTHEDIFFLILDSNIMGAGNERDAEWVEEQLTSAAATSSNWQIAVCHHPFYPISQIPKDLVRAETMRAVFLPILEERGVDLILCGHQHLYARTAAMLGGVPDGGGLVQLMTASGSKESYSPSDNEYIEITAGAPAYIVIEATPETLEITTYDELGEPFDSVRIGRRN